VILAGIKANEWGADLFLWWKGNGDEVAT